MSANHAALGYLDEIGAGDTLAGPDGAVFPFMDLATGARWRVRPNRGPLPWWVLAPARRVPGTRPGSYLLALKLAFARCDDTVLDRLDPDDPLYVRLIEPLAVAVLNAAPAEGSAKLLWPALAASFGRGAAACRPLTARNGLSASFVDPALVHLAATGGTVRFGHRLRAVTLGTGRVLALDFTGASVELGAADSVVLALPPAAIADLLPSITVPRQSRAIVNAHFLITPVPAPLDDAPFVGLIGGAAQWLFVRGEVASVTVSAADSLAQRPNDEIADLLWADAARALGRAATAHAHHQRAPRHLRPDSGRGGAPPARRDGLEQPLARRRLDRHRPSRDHRKRGALGPNCGPSGGRFLRGLRRRAAWPRYA